MVEVRHVWSPRVRPARRIVNVGLEHPARRDATVSDSRTSLRTLHTHVERALLLYVLRQSPDEMRAVIGVYVNR